METGDTAKRPAQRSKKPKRATQRGPVGDLFAPFFDVVFYSPSKEIGTAVALEAQARIDEQTPGQERLAATNKAADAGLRASQSASQKLALDDTGLIGTTRIELSTVGGGLQSFSPEGLNTPAGQLSLYRSNLQVTMLSAAALQATLTLTPPYEDAIKIVDNKAIKFGSLMEIQWGYLAPDGSKPAISDKGLFRITQPSIKFGQTTTITIGGFDILSSSLKTTDTRCQWLRSEYPCDLDIIRAIIKKKLGPTTKLDTRDVLNDSRLRARKGGNSVIQADDEWTFFRRILRQNDVGFSQGTGGDFSIRLYDEKLIDNQEPYYSLLWYKQPSDEKEIPMISFETNPIMSLFAGAPGVRGQRTICRDSVTKKIEVVDRDPGTTGKPQVGECVTGTTEAAFSKEVTKTSSGSGAVYADLDKTCTSGRFFTQPCRRYNRKEEQERENVELRRHFNTNATALCPGVPGLVPQTIVKVVGVGTTFSGNYRVMKVVHNIGSGYTVKLDLLRAASSNVKGQGDAPSKDKKNKKKTVKNAKNGDLVVPILEDPDDKTKGTAADTGGCVDQVKTDAKQASADKARLAEIEAKQKAVAAAAEAIENAAKRLFGAD